MTNVKATFSSFSVDDMAKAKDFYSNNLGLTLKDEKMGLGFSLPGGAELFIYQKPDHQPASFTVLNFVVEDINQQVSQMSAQGIKFEKIDLGKGAKTDEQGIMRGLSVGQGPDIAWFKDPAGNVLSVLQPE